MADATTETVTRHLSPARDEAIRWLAHVSGNPADATYRLRAFREYLAEMRVNSCFLSRDAMVERITEGIDAADEAAAILNAAGHA